MIAQMWSLWWNHSIAKWSKKESHWEGTLREWKRQIARKPDCVNSGRAKLPASISAWETAALDTLGSMYVKLAQDSLECLWESSLNPKCMFWVYVGMRAWPEGRVLVARICCQPLSILYSPHAHMEDRNNLFKNVPLWYTMVKVNEACVCWEGLVWNPVQSALCSWRVSLIMVFILKVLKLRFNVKIGSLSSPCVLLLRDVKLA